MAQTVGSPREAQRLSPNSVVAFNTKAGAGSAFGRIRICLGHLRTDKLLLNKLLDWVGSSDLTATDLEAPINLWEAAGREDADFIVYKSERLIA